MSKAIVLVLVMVIVLVSSWSLLQPHLFYVHDYLHAARIAEMARGLVDMHLPVRWSQNFGYGYGMPLFQFYAPLPFFVGALFYLLGAPITASVSILFILPSLGTAIGAYLLGKELFSKSGGVVIATLFTLAPYRAVNLFVRGAVSEAWGMMWMPWILLAGTRYLRKQSFFDWLLLTGFLAALVLSHNLTALLFFPLSAIFFVGQQLSTQKEIKINRLVVTKLVKVAMAYLLSVGLSAFYIFPALLEKGYTQVESVIVGGYFDYKVHFVALSQFFEDSFGYGGSGWGTNDGISFFLGWGTLAGLIISSLCIAIYLFRERKIGTKLYLPGIVLLLGVFSLFMTHSKSLPLWDSVPFLRFVQFPWRWLSISALFLAIFSATFVNIIKNKYLIALFVSIVFLMSSIPARNNFKPSAYLGDSDEYYFSDPVRIRTEFSEVLPDYLPEGFNIREPIIENSLVVNKQNFESITVLENKVAYKNFIVTATESAEIVLAITDYPGWEVFSQNQILEHASNESGLISVLLPEGQSEVVVRLTNTPIRAMSDAISALSLVAISLATIMYIRRKS